MSRTESQYWDYKKPSWAPPSWLFGPVWTVLYIGIFISFGYVTYLYTQGSIPLSVLAPFIANLVFNFLFTPIQFGLRSFALAAIDIILVLVTLLWAIIAIYGLVPWVAYINLPYLAWVSFATVLQLTVTAMNS